MIFTSNPENNLYDDEFYVEQVEESLRSARQYALITQALYTPKKVIDFGCGRGTWLQAFKEIGAEQLVGLDGNWNSQDKMVDQSKN
jgi:predicted RNA methylase